MHLLQVVAEFAVVLGIMVLVHEFGHFAVAKLCGVRVEAFALGFGTRLFGYVHNGTDYRVNLLPLGGYVKMAGDQPGETTYDPGHFNTHPRWQRVLIALAGPVANFILAFVLLFVVAHYHHEVDQYLNGAAVLDYVPAGTPAATAGMGAGDTILSLDGKANPSWLTVEEEAALHMGATLPVTVLHTRTPLAQAAWRMWVFCRGNRRSPSPCRRWKPERPPKRPDCSRAIRSSGSMPLPRTPFRRFWLTCRTAMARRRC